MVNVEDSSAEVKLRMKRLRQTRTVSQHLQANLAALTASMGFALVDAVRRRLASDLLALPTELGSR